MYFARGTSFSKTFIKRQFNKPLTFRHKKLLFNNQLKNRSFIHYSMMPFPEWMHFPPFPQHHWPNIRRNIKFYFY